jgi:hypothetical protein
MNYHQRFVDIFYSIVTRRVFILRVDRLFSNISSFSLSSISVSQCVRKEKVTQELDRELENCSGFRRLDFHCKAKARLRN